MEAYKRRYQYDDTRTSYVDGNTVRKLRVAPQREEEQYEIPQRRPRQHGHQKTLSGISFTSLVVLTVAIIATVYVCVDFLMVQNQVTVMNKQIVSLEKKITTLTKENDATYEAINTAVDMDEIYRVAVEELGMVYPNKNEVITYQSGSADYVRQYEDIPE